MAGRFKKSEKLPPVRLGSAYRCKRLRKMASIHSFSLSILASAVLCAPPVAWAADKMNQPVGLAVEISDAQILRNGDKLPLPLHRGEVVLPGDRIETGPAGAATIAFCPTKSALRLEKGSSVTFFINKYSVKGRGGTQGTLPVCVLPKIFANNQSGDNDGESQRETLQGAALAPTELAARLGLLSAEVRAQVTAETAPFNEALGRNPLDFLALLARGTAYQRAGLDFDAGDDFQKAGQLLENPAWIAPLKNSSSARSPRPRPSTQGVLRGKTFALVVGISHFSNLHQDLMYADQDAISFRDYLRLPRGGGLQDDVQLKMITNEAATTPAIKNGLVDFLIANATPEDTVILFIATHGVIENKTDDAYLLTAESDLEKLSSTAIPMSMLLELLDSKRCHAGRVLIFVDVCHAERVGNFRSRAGSIEKVLRSGNSEVFAFAASRASELSKEGAEYGGGHGAFSYFLLKGLNSTEPNAGANPDLTTITLDRLIEYVHERVRAATEMKQNPQEMGDLDRNLAIVTDVRLTPLPLADWPTRGFLNVAATRGVDSLQQPAPEVQRFRLAISEGRILPGEPSSAFDQLANLRSFFGENRPGYLAEENRIRVALENAGEQVLLEYLKGDEIAQSAVDFDRCAAAFAAAFRLTAEAFSLQSNSFFCQGRALVGRRDFGAAMPLLERAAKMTPAEAYVWNALGIGYLQMPDYDRAVSAFQDAIRRAPFWAYPRHNLAVALRERGNLQGAIDQYLAAIQIAPQYFYLRYNLGLLYQQINDRQNAELRYKEAFDKAPGEPARARVLIAQAMLEDERGRPDAALRLLQNAEQHHPEREDFFTLRHDKALILARDDGHRAEAESLWGDNLRDDPDYIPSIVALAEALEKWGEPDQAAGWYREILARRENYVGARLRLATLLTNTGHAPDAQRILEEGIAKDPHQPLLLEALGDIDVQIGTNAAATDAFCKALAFSAAPAVAAEINRKMKRIHSQASNCPRR